LRPTTKTIEELQPQKNNDTAVVGNFIIGLPGRSEGGTRSAEGHHIIIMKENLRSTISVFFYWLYNQAVKVHCGGRKR
jgi:hypothetical protein